MSTIVRASDIYFFFRISYTFFALFLFSFFFCSCRALFIAFLHDETRAHFDLYGKVYSHYTIVIVNTTAQNNNTTYSHSIVTIYRHFNSSDIHIHIYIQYSHHHTAHHIYLWPNVLYTTALYSASKWISWKMKWRNEINMFTGKYDPGFVHMRTTNNNHVTIRVIFAFCETFGRYNGNGHQLFVHFFFQSPIVVVCRQHAIRFWQHVQCEFIESV